MKQQEFKQSKPKGLVISTASKKVLTKNQQAFNKLTKRIEKLHKDIEKKQLQLDTALKIYGNEIHPIVNQLDAHRRKLVTILWDVYQSYKLSKTDQRHLKNILKDHVFELCRQPEGREDEALNDMFAQLTGETFAKMEQREKESLKEEMLRAAKLMDLDIDLDDLDMNDQRAMEQKVAELEQKMAEKQEQEEQNYAPFKKSKAPKKKTPKQLETERIQKAAEEMKQKNISTIYKQLAKLFHPDLEQDEERKIEKEVLMKELTAAYEAKNLHMLLMLELKWIHNENDHLETLSEEKLTIYLQILREQARDLEYEANSIVEQPRYNVLIELFGLSVQRYPIETVHQHLADLKQIESAFKKDLRAFQSPTALKHVKEMIQEWKQDQRQKSEANDIEEDFMRMMFS
jgi:hypothetical protein